MHKAGRERLAVGYLTTYYRCGRFLFQKAGIRVLDTASRLMYPNKAKSCVTIG